MGTPTRILVVGAGAWGTALAVHLARAGKEVFLWGRDPVMQEHMQKVRENQKYLPGISFPEHLHVCVDFKDERWAAVVVAVPSEAFASVLALLKPYLLPKAHVLCATKGFCQGQWLEVIAASQLGATPFGLLSGPSFATEVAQGAFTAMVLATQCSEFAEFWQERLHTSYFRVYRSTDVLGVALGGVVKNILALAVGIAEGLGLGANAKSALITRGLAEMMRLGVASGARSETLMGLSGLGDLVLTTTGLQSRNRRCGVLLGQGFLLADALASIGQVVESVSNATPLVAYAKLAKVEMPICEAVELVLENRLSVREALWSLISRPATEEY